MTTILAFLLTLGILIVVHEYGHYRVALACGVKVLRFSVGFGRVLWRRQRHPDGTEFVVCALPLGGYVRMLGDEDGPIAPQDRARTFNGQSLWRRAAIVVAGPLANLALAVLLFALAGWIGQDEPRAVLAAPGAGTLADRAGLRAGDWVHSASLDGSEWSDIASMSDLRARVLQAALQREMLSLQVSDREGRAARVLRLDLSAIEHVEVDAAFIRTAGLGGVFSEPVLGEVKVGGAAAQAGLRAGDRVLRIETDAGSEFIADAVTLRERIRHSLRGGVATVQRWHVERGGHELVVEVTPRAVREGTDLIGRIEAYVGQPPATVHVRLGPVEGLVQGVTRTWDMSSLTLRMLGRMLIGQASLKNLSGPLTIADYAGQSVQHGLTYYLAFLALVSVSLGVLNLLPLPMLDGGHLMVYIFEGVTGHPVSDRWQARLQRGGIVVLLMMMSVALFNDVARLFGLY